MTEKCKDRIDQHYNSTMETLRLLWAGYTEQECPDCEGEGEIFDTCGFSDNQYCQNPRCENSHTLIECELCEGSGELSEDMPDIGSLNEYGLGFDYVAPNTFNDQPEGYFRYQLSWGGPSDEFRIYADRVGEWNWSIYKIEYWFLDWFDGAKVLLSGDDYIFIQDLMISYFMDSGSFDHVYSESMED